MLDGALPLGGAPKVLRFQRAGVGVIGRRRPHPVRC